VVVDGFKLVSSYGNEAIKVREGSYNHQYNNGWVDVPSTLVYLSQDGPNPPHDVKFSNIFGTCGAYVMSAGSTGVQGFKGVMFDNLNITTTGSTPAFNTQLTGAGGYTGCKELTVQNSRFNGFVSIGAFLKGAGAVTGNTVRFVNNVFTMSTTAFIPSEITDLDILQIKNNKFSYTSILSATMFRRSYGWSLFEFTDNYCSGIDTVLNVEAGAPYDQFLMTGNVYFCRNTLESTNYLTVVNTAHAAGTPKTFYILDNVLNGAAIYQFDSSYTGYVVVKQDTAIVPSGDSSFGTSATPSTSSGSLLVSGGTTTVTNFIGGFAGQIITLLFSPGITITDGTNIFLTGSADFVGKATDTLQLICKADGKWYEVARSVN
jgi:hypothetical protein